jgi:hypothetical protein
MATPATQATEQANLMSRFDAAAAALAAKTSIPTPTFGPPDVDPNEEQRFKTFVLENLRKIADNTPNLP